MKPVTLYGSPWCSYSALARRLLIDKGAEVEDIDVIDEPERRAEMVARSGGRDTLPQIFIGGEHVGGFQAIHELEQAGRLDRLLADD
ncbi:MAG: glutaredoxin 3 [Amaricoccus sp.]